MESSWETWTRLEKKLGRPITYEEMLAIIVYYEYGTTLSGEGFALALEATARQFYEFCGSDGVCEGDQLWRFLGGHSAATAHPDEAYLKLLRGELTANESRMWKKSLNGASRILNTSAWTDGMREGRPFAYGNISCTLVLSRGVQTAPNSWGIMYYDPEGNYIIVMAGGNVNPCQ